VKLSNTIQLSPNYYILHTILLNKSNKTIYRKFADEADNPVNNPKIYNVERNI